MIEYRLGNDLAIDPVTELYRRSTLGERRPIDRRDNVVAMLEHANLVITAWAGERLVGIARSFSDFAYVTYLADLAVDREFQRHGIGKELIRRTQQHSGEHTMIVLLAAPAAVDYYPHVGFTQHHSAWLLKPGDRVA